MIALPSIAFGGFSGSAKGVTARQMAGRSILSLKCWPTGLATNAQLARRASLTKISKSWAKLSATQMAGWDRLAEKSSGATSLGEKAEISGLNQYIRLNCNRVMAGEAIISDAPDNNVAVPNVEYTSVSITPELVIFGGITHESSPYKLVVKMSGSQSAGVSSGWSKTVIISSDTEDDWGEADLTKLYLKTIGVEPVVGDKVFIETYWLDTSTGFAGLVKQDYVVVSGESSYQKRMRVTDDDLQEDTEQHVSSIDVDFSTDSPAVYTDTMSLGHGNVESSYAYLDEALPADCIGMFYVLARGAGEDGSLHPQSFQVQTMNRSGKGQIAFMHRGGKYIKPTEVFGTGVLY